ncbi:serine hydrolase domain-containing protein [Shewanella woodyi]|uniref:Beta-lactamase n=1 Tax=Shewanella woodyi (strain ATCC 51908 / MS32) TaxID=392500 RepID=B1KFN2_SHEWM|nr:serine hydrolase domain-containing protein [Shewanella woodyi]ACA85198.1 beta-lactamase [Shewanella woodyi ATCC 51908]
MNTIKLTVLSMILTFCINHHVFAHVENADKRKKLNPTVTQKVDYQSLIESMITDSPQPFSGTVLLMQKGKKLVSLSKGDGITQDSSFVLASLSKQITATLIMQAVESGRLTLDSHLNQYLSNDDEPKHSLDNKLPLSQGYHEGITIAQLLTHTSGINTQGKPNLFEPGTRFQYSNLGYTLLGQVLEKVNKLSFSEQISQFNKKYKLSGLDAKTGSIDNIRQHLPTLSLGLTETAKGLSQSDLTINTSLIPAGGIISTTRAFSDFQQKLHSGQLISPKSYQLMTTPHTEITFLWPNMHYGYGLRLNFDDNLTEYSHTGYLSGYMSMTLYYPQYNLSLVMLENLSLNLNYLDRVFELHNQIRAAIRQSLINRNSKV